MRRQRIGELLWILCAQFFLAEQVTSHAWKLPYSFTRNYISDLGAIHCGALICSPWHEIMNGSFMLQGLLIAAGAVALWTHFRGIGKVALALLAICAVGVVLVGLAPSDQNPALHTVGATIHFVAAGLGICVMGVALWRDGERESNRRWMGYLSVVTGTIILTATAALGSLGHSNISAGTIERIGAYSIVIWLMAMGCQKTFWWT